VSNFDAYERKARLAPGLLALLPVPLSVVALGYRNVPVVSIVLSVLAFAGGPFLLSETVRGLGVKAETSLVLKWNGLPTTLLLRLRSTSSNPVERSQWRQRVERLSEQSLLNETEELNNPVLADQTIETAVTRVRMLARDSPKHTKILNLENRSYGFQRNLLGIRSVGRAVSGLCSVVTGAFLIWSGTHGGGVAFTDQLFGFLIDVVIFAGWWFMPSADRTKVAADKYAQELMRTADQLASNP
jgi:hypothetical protein